MHNRKSFIHTHQQKKSDFTWNTHLLELVLVELEETLVFAIGGAERVVVHVGLLQTLLGQDALDGSLLELDGIGLCKL